MKKSSLPKYKFLLNANISRKIIRTLTDLLGLNFKHVSQISDKNLSDSQIVEIAKNDKRVIITHDLDYGEIYYLKEQGKLGVIMLRLTNQTSENVIAKLTEFFTNPKNKKITLSNSLIIISEEKIRVFSPS